MIPAGLIGAERNLQSLTRWWKLVATKASDVGYDLFAGDSYSLQNQSLQNATRHLGNFIAYEFAGGSDDRRRVAEGEPLHVMDAPLADRVLAGLRLAIVVLAGWLTWQAGVRRDRLSLAAAFGLCSVATLVVAPIARAHYFVLLVPAIPLVPLWFARAGQAKFAALGGLDSSGAGPGPLPGQSGGRPVGPVGHRHCGLVCRQRDGDDRDPAPLGAAAAADRAACVPSAGRRVGAASAVRGR